MCKKYTRKEVVRERESNPTNNQTLLLIVSFHELIFVAQGKTCCTTSSRKLLLGQGTNLVCVCVAGWPPPPPNDFLSSVDWQKGFVWWSSISLSRWLSTPVKFRIIASTTIFRPPPPPKRKKKITHTHTHTCTFCYIWPKWSAQTYRTYNRTSSSELTTELLSVGRLQKIMHKIYPYWALSLGTNLNLNFFHFMPKITIKAGPKWAPKLQLEMV